MGGWDGPVGRNVGMSVGDDVGGEYLQLVSPKHDWPYHVEHFQDPFIGENDKEMMCIR